MALYTQEQYDALKAAIAQGAKKVKYADKEVEYRDLSEMMSLLQTMGGELGVGRPRVHYAVHSKGTNEC